MSAPVFEDVNADEIDTTLTDDERALLTYVGLNPTPRPEPDRDRWGRYSLPHPVTGKKQGWTRVTTLAKAIDDTYNLERWAQRMAATGFAIAPRLVNAIAEIDDPHGTGKPEVDAIVDKAKLIAGASRGSSLGTAMHTVTELHDLGHPLNDLPAPYLADVRAYADALAAAGLTVTDEWVERIVLCPSLGAAGTFDRILTDAAGNRYIGDVKTAKDMNYSWVATSIQLSVYANAEVLVPLTGGTYEPMPEVDKTTAIVIHMPVGSGECTLHDVDIAQGWDLAHLCHTVRERRKTKGLASVRKPSTGLQCPPDVDALDTPDEAIAKAKATENVAASTGPLAGAPDQGEAPDPTAAASPETAPADMLEARNAWIIDRLTTLKTEHPDRFAAFRDARHLRLPNLAPRPPWTNEDIDAIVEIVAPFETAFGAPDPAGVAQRAQAEADRLAAINEPPAADPSAETPAWGSDGPGCELALEENANGILASLASLNVDHPDRYAIVKLWHDDARQQGRPWKGGDHHQGISVRQWHIIRAALRCLRCLWDAPAKTGYGTIDDRTRHLLALTIGEDLQPTWRTGAIFGSLTIEQAEDLCATAELFAAGDRPTRAVVRDLVTASAAA